MKRENLEKATVLIEKIENLEEQLTELNKTGVVLRINKANSWAILAISVGDEEDENFGIANKLIDSLKWKLSQNIETLSAELDAL